MRWIRSFQLFLFDFDGLLVNTEHLHFQSYINALDHFGLKLDWPFSRFCELAHFNSGALKEALCSHFPQLREDWQRLYDEKINSYNQLIGSGKIELMAGAQELLESLALLGIRRCVATHSKKAQVDLIRSQLPLLNTIPHWITREDYEKPKPAPDAYLRAIELYGKTGDRIIGFEDSIRGLRALAQTPALPILVCPTHHPLLDIAKEQAFYFPSFLAIPEDWNFSSHC